MTIRRTQTFSPARAAIAHRLRSGTTAFRTLRAAGAAAASVTALAAVTLLGGCATSPSSHYYTLGGFAPAQTANTGAVSYSGSPLMIEMTPVNVPDTVERPQIVTTTGPGKIEIQDYERWAGPLADEIGGALSSALTTSLHAIDVYRAPHPAGATLYRITVNVRRFESVVGERATIDTVWSVVRSTDNLTLTCKTMASVPVQSGYDALALGHRKALSQVAQAIDAGVRLEAGTPALADPAASGDAGTGKGKPDATTTSVLAPAAPLLRCPA